MTDLTTTRLKSALDNAITEGRDFDAHVLTIRMQDGIDENKAKMRAWMEGPNGLANRQA